MVDVRPIADDLGPARSALEAAADVLSRVREDISLDDWLETRAHLGVLVAAFEEHANRMSEGLGSGGAKERILRYLRRNVGRPVNKDELAGVAGISEWARRIRELRVDEGWPISSCETRHDLAAGEYVLEADRADESIRSTWDRARDVRDMSGGDQLSARERVLRFLSEIAPAAADREQLSYVARPQSAARVLAELRSDGHRLIDDLDDASMRPGTVRLDRETYS